MWRAPAGVGRRRPENGNLAIGIEVALGPRMTQADSWLRAAQKRGQHIGYGELGDTELIATLIRSGARATALQVAGRVLDDVGDLPQLSEVGLGRLQDIKGVTARAAERLVVAAELARRIRLRRAAPRAQFVTPARVAEWMSPRIGALVEEQLWVLALDGRNRLRGMRCVARGGAHGLSVTAREILRVALSEGASAFIVVHNHPSGDHLPSREDVWMTGQLREAADVVGVPLLDHVIVTADGRHSSLYELGDLVRSEPGLKASAANAPPDREVLSLPFEANGPHGPPSCCHESPGP